MSQWWVHQQFYAGGFPLVMSWAFWVIFSITLHELAHGVVAIWQGDSTPRDTGHMTWNPLVHMGMISLAMFAFIGIAWGLMPTDPSRYRDKRRGRIYVALAGPVLNLGLALIAIVALGLYVRLLPEDTALTLFQERMINFFYLGGMLNLVLFGLNLLPIPPLDGAQVLMGMSMRFYQWFNDPKIRQYAFFGVLLIFYFTPLGPVAFAIAEKFTWEGAALIHGGTLVAGN